MPKRGEKMLSVSRRLVIHLTMVSVLLGLDLQVIPKLRRFSTKGWGGEFEVNKVLLENEIRQRIMQDSACGYDILQEVMHSPLTKIDIFYSYQSEDTLQELLLDEMKEEIAISFRQVSVSASIGNDTHLQLARFTDSRKRVLNPIETNYESVDYIDRIEEDREGNVMLFKGDDVMTIEFEDDPSCVEVESEKQKEEFKDLELPLYKTTSYPARFDWGCELLGNTGFCTELKYNCDLRGARSDVCSLIHGTYITNCHKTSIRITNMTGFFRRAIPFLAPFHFPIESLDGDSTKINHTVGLVFPCLHNRKLDYPSM